MQQRKVAMPWFSDEHLSDKEAKPVSVRRAGFKGYVGDSETEDFAKEHKDFISPSDKPDLTDDHLSHFVREHGSREDWEYGGGKLTNVPLKDVYATQSHVSRYHIKRYLDAPNDKAWYLKHGGEDDGYVANHHPMFVTHEGRLHTVDGHHRVAAALARGDSHIQAWHFDLDKHPVQRQYDLIREPGKIRGHWGPTGEDCEDCLDTAPHHARPKMAQRKY